MRLLYQKKPGGFIQSTVLVNYLYVLVTMLLQIHYKVIVLAIINV